MNVNFNHTRKEEIEDGLIAIEIYDKREKISENVIVRKLTDTKFQTAENAVMLCRLTVGTEFETRINKEGQYEIIKITRFC